MREYLYITNIDDPNFVHKVTKTSIVNNPNWRFYRGSNCWSEFMGSQARTAHDTYEKALLQAKLDIAGRISSEEAEAKKIIDKIVDSKLIQIALDKRISEFSNKNRKK